MVTPVSIIIPAFNQLAYCRQCIESVRAHTDYPYKLILVDNGSTDGVSEYFDSVPGAVVVHSDKNLGFPGGVNLGLAHAEGHVLLLNSDTIAPRQWLTRLVTALDSAPRIGLVGPMSNYVSGPQLITGPALESLEQINGFAETLAREKPGQRIDTDRVVGFCMLIRDAAFQAVGRFDESFGIGNFEDDDYCLRVRKAGFRVCIAQDCFVFHFGSRTFSAMGFDNESFRALIERNEAAFNQKWGTRPGSARGEQIADNLLNQARELAGAGKTVEAIARIKDAIAMAPCHAPAYCQLGELLLSLGKPVQAAEYFRRALRHDPNSIIAKNHLSHLPSEFMDSSD